MKTASNVVACEAGVKLNFYPKCFDNFMLWSKRNIFSLNFKSVYFLLALESKKERETIVSYAIVNSDFTVNSELDTRQKEVKISVNKSLTAREFFKAPAKGDVGELPWIGRHSHK